MIINALVSIAILVGLTIALAVPAEAATKKDKKSYIYYRQSDPAYYAAPRARNGKRLVVQPRSYLSAGTQTKQHEEHYADYAFPPGGSWDYSNRNSFQGSFTRMPLADPWDIPGWTKY